MVYFGIYWAYCALYQIYINVRYSDRLEQILLKQKGWTDPDGSIPVRVKMLFLGIFIVVSPLLTPLIMLAEALDSVVRLLHGSEGKKD